MRLEVIDIEKLRSNSGQIEGLPANPRKWDANEEDVPFTNEPKRKIKTTDIQ